MFQCPCCLKLFMSTCSRSLWPRLLSRHRKARRAKATTAPSALRRGRQRANTGCRPCAADTSLASRASSAGWKLRDQPLNVHRSARLLDFNRKLNHSSFFSTSCMSLLDADDDVFLFVCSATRKRSVQTSCCCTLRSWERSTRLSRRA